MRRAFFLIILLNYLLLPGMAYGAFPSPSDNTINAPTRIFVDKEVVWFYEAKYSRFLNREDLVWQFNKKSGTWRIKNKIDKEIKKKIDKRKSQVIPEIPLPKLSKEEVLNYRKSLSLNDIIGVDQGIGPSYKIGHRIWFGISFYDAEGIKGVGGIGYYDSLTKNVVIRRPKFIIESSVSALLVDKGELWMGTWKFGEYGYYPTNGLIRYNWLTKETKIFNPEKDNLCGLLITDIAKDGHDIWVTHEYGVSRYRSGRWENYFLERSASGRYLVSRLSPKEIYLKTVKGIIGAEDLDRLGNFFRTAEKYHLTSAYEAVDYIYEHSEKMKCIALITISKLNDPRGTQKIERLFKEIKSNRKHPLYGCLLDIFAERRDERALPIIIKDLDNPDRMIRQEAVRRLPYYPAQKVESLIIRMFNDPNLHVRDTARDSFVKLKGRDAIPTLIKMLGEGEKFTKSYIIYDLEELTGLSFGRYWMGASELEKKEIEQRWKKWWKSNKPKVSN